LLRAAAKQSAGQQAIEYADNTARPQSHATAPRHCWYTHTQLLSSQQATEYADNAARPQTHATAPRHA